MPALRTLLVLVFLTASACGESDDSEETATPEVSVPEEDLGDGVMSMPEDHGCGDGTVDSGETCDDGGANCPEGWGLCMRCEHCDGWVVRARTFVPDADAESPLPSPPFCTETVQDLGASTPRSRRVMTYDDHGRLLSDALDRDPEVGTELRAYEYDDDGHRVGLRRTVGEDHLIYRDQYRVQNGRRTGFRRDTDGDDLPDLRQRYAYDDAGRLVSIETRGGGTETFTYNAFGHLTAQAEEAGERTDIERDERGRMTGRNPSRRVPFIYRYDPEGRLTVELAQLGRVRQDRWNHTYEDGRLVRSEFHSDPDTLARTCQITTDEHGRVTERACDRDLDGEADRTTTFDYACVDALRDSLPRTVEEEGASDEAADSD